MSDIMIYIALGMGIVLIVMSTVFYHKFRIWKLILIILTSAAYAFLRLFPEIVDVYIPIDMTIEWYGYYLFLVVIILAINFKSKIKITQNLTDYDFFEMEKELDELKSTSELLRLRYISTIELLNEGMLFYNDTLDGFFASEQFGRITGITKSDMTIDEYVTLIHPDDQNQYLSTIKKANRKTPSFDIKYRISREGIYVWVEEKGRVFDYEKKLQILSSIKGIDIKLFPETLIHEIDSLPTEQQLFQYLSQISKEPESFYLIMIQLTNIPDINSRFGRDVGNLMIAEYIKKMRFHFAKDINSIFRITGIQFALIIREQRKYDVMNRALQSGGDLINLMINIGGIQQVVYPNLGIIKHEPWSTYSLSEYVGFANKAMEEAIRNQKKNYSVFGE
ncbi:MAG: PAS domain-containing protein [Candidatus Izemoplasmatales bacterium]|nr:PAS domain-containing protein [Candidatus Izemoplasmatales bacterium]MDD3865511.1 PAS domain-containing protein [Candidatus Izemoplasmatales bacterium]